MTTATMYERLVTLPGESRTQLTAGFLLIPLNFSPLCALTCLSLAHSALSLLAQPIEPSTMMLLPSGILHIRFPPGRLSVPFMDQLLFLI